MRVRVCPRACACAHFHGTPLLSNHFESVSVLRAEVSLSGRQPIIGSSSFLGFFFLNIQSAILHLLIRELNPLIFIIIIDR